VTDNPACFKFRNMSASAPPPGLDQVTVIIVTYNSAHCVPALARGLASCPHITVVDNASRDGTVQAVRLGLPQARVAVQPRNLGFGAANNIGLRAASTPYSLLLNPDCEIGPEAIGALLATAQRWPQAAMVAPQILTPAGEPELNYRWPATAWTSAGPGADGPCCVGFACGAAWLLNMAHLRQTGFFDEGFFLYYEDDDLCHRLFDARLPMVLDPAVRVVHRSRGSVGGSGRWRAEYLRGFHHAQSKVRFTSKYRGVEAARRQRRQVLALALLALPLRLLLPAPRQVARLLGRLAGLWQLKSGAGVRPDIPA
jgi:GT2 family glycosyltransferase